MAELDSRFASKSGKESIRQGRVVAYHMLKDCELVGLERELSIEANLCGIRRSCLVHDMGGISAIGLAEQVSSL